MSNRTRFAARAGSLRASSFQEDDNTIEVLWTTGAEVVRHSWFSDPYVEALRVDDDSIRLGRMQDGSAPFLDSHDGSSLSNVIVRVLPGSVEIRDGKGTCRVQLSEAPEHAGIVANIRAGVIANVSVGYATHAEEVTKATDGNPERREATDWEPFEVSAVPMGADPSAHIRSMHQRAGVPFESPASEPATTQPEDPATDTEERDMKPDETTTAPAEPTKSADEIRKEAKLEERARVLSIRAAALDLGLGNDDRVERLVTTDVDADAARKTLISWSGEARRLAIDAAADADDADPTTSSVISITRDERTNLHEGMVEGILATTFPRSVERRSDGSEKVSGFEITERGRPYMGASLRELAKTYVRKAHGVNTDGLGRRSLAREAFKVRAIPGQGSGDFPSLLEDVMGKALKVGYDSTENTFAQWMTRRDLNDFKGAKSLKVEGPRELKDINEQGKYERATVLEGKETWNLTRKGVSVGFSFEAMVNDDLGALLIATSDFGAAAREMEGDIAYLPLTTNAGLGSTMADAVALFDASRGNIYGGSGTALDEDEILAMLTAGLGMTGLQGKRIRLNFGNVIHGRLVVPKVAKMLAPVNPVTTATSVPGNVAGLNYIYEHRLDDVNSGLGYILAPTNVRNMEYGYLTGEEGVLVERNDLPGRIGVDFIVDHIFGAGAVDTMMILNKGA